MRRFAHRAGHYSAGERRGVTRVTMRARSTFSPVRDGRDFASVHASVRSLKVMPSAMLIIRKLRMLKRRALSLCLQRALPKNTLAMEKHRQRSIRYSPLAPHGTFCERRRVISEETESCRSRFGDKRKLIDIARRVSLRFVFIFFENRNTLRQSARSSKRKAFDETLRCGSEKSRSLGTHTEHAFQKNVYALVEV